MKQLIPKPARIRSRAVALAFGLHGISRLLRLAGWTIQVAAGSAYRLAAAAERSATRIKAH